MPRTVDSTAEDIRSWGIRRFVLKSDQEPSILAPKARIIIEALGSDFDRSGDICSGRARVERDR